MTNIVTPYQLSTQFSNALALHTNPDTGEFDHEGFMSVVKSLEGGVAQLGQYLKQRDITRSAFKSAHADALKAIRTQEAADERMTEALGKMMVEAGISSATTADGLWGVSVQPNRDVSVIVHDASRVPPHLLNPLPDPPTQTPNKLKIKAELQTGKAVDGCELQYSHRVTIK